MSSNQITMKHSISNPSQFALVAGPNNLGKEKPVSAIDWVDHEVK